jgi:O-antigen/teichoic acid export membrane protein
MGADSPFVAGEYIEAPSAVTETENPAPSGRRALFGALMLSTASACKLALQLVLVPVLARILGPKAFGLMSIAMSLVLFANMLSDAGMGAAVVRQPTEDRELESTIFWLAVMVGVALASLVCLAAWPLALVFEQPRLRLVLLALAPILALSGSLAVPNARLVRAQRFTVFAAGDVLSAVVSASCGIVLALKGYGVWSLVWQQLLLWTSKMIWVTIMAGFRPLFVFQVDRVRHLLHFSLNNLAANISDFAGKSLPILIVGKLLGLTAVGHFSMAYQLTRAADMVISSPVNLAVFSAVATTRSQTASASFVITGLRVMLILLAPLFCGLMLTADLVTGVLLGPTWIATAPALAAFAPCAFLLCIFGLISAALLGEGKSDRVLRLTLVCGAAMSLGTLGGAQFGIVWAAAGLSLGVVVVAPAYFASLSQVMKIGFSRLWSATATSLVATAAMAVAVLFVRGEISHLGVPLQLVLAVATGALAFVSVTLLMDRQQLLEDISKLRRRPPLTP